MKSITIMVSCIFVLSLFSQCSSAQFDKKAPFNISKAYYQNWVGGRASSKGTLISIEFSNSPSNKIVFDSIFFKGKVVQLERTTYDGKQVITGNFATSNIADKNIIMHVDPRKEMGNKVPGVTTNFPFELTDKECVISYFIKQKKRYYKLTNLAKKESVYYP